MPVRQWVLSLTIPLRLLLAAQPKLMTPVLQVGHRVITRHLLDQAGLKAEQANRGAVTLIQPSLWMKGSAANLNIHLHFSGPRLGASSQGKTSSRSPRMTPFWLRSTLNRPLPNPRTAPVGVQEHCRAPLGERSAFEFPVPHTPVNPSMQTHWRRWWPSEPGGRP